MDIFKIMGVRAAYYITFLKIWMLPPDPVKILEIVKLRTGKRTSGRYKSEIRDQTCGSLIHMGRICDAMTGFHQWKYIVKGDGSSIDEKISYSVCHFIDLIHDLLFSEYVLPVWDGQQWPVYKIVKSQDVFQRGKETAHMNFLLCCPLHAGITVTP